MGIGSGWIGQVVWALALLYMHGYYPLDFLLNAFCGNPKKKQRNRVFYVEPSSHTKEVDSSLSSKQKQAEK